MFAHIGGNRENMNKAPVAHNCMYRVSIILVTFAFNSSVFLNVVFFRLFYDNITFRHLFIIMKCPAELNFDCKILIRSVPSTGVTE